MTSLSIPIVKIIQLTFSINEKDGNYGLIEKLNELKKERGEVG